MIIASKDSCKIGQIITFHQMEFGDSPVANGKIIREATLKEFLVAEHPNSTKWDMDRYAENPYNYHYEVSTD